MTQKLFSLLKLDLKVSSENTQMNQFVSSNCQSEKILNVRFQRKQFFLFLDDFFRRKKVQQIIRTNDNYDDDDCLSVGRLRDQIIAATKTDTSMVFLVD